MCLCGPLDGYFHADKTGPTHAARQSGSDFNVKHFVHVALIWLMLALAASAQDRIALVIGNGDYSAVAALDNPVSDAELMASSLTRVGFRVTKVLNSDQAIMKRAVADFGRALREAGPETTALFYYAGHAVQSFGNNYLLPVDAAIRHQAELDLYGVEADWVVRQLYSARVQTSIVILDACRNNPFEHLSGFERQGLAEMNAPTGSFIAYATAPGNVALDGTSGNSPYTAALAHEIINTPQPIEQISKAVRLRVLRETGGAQTPWDSSSLTSDFYFRPPESAPQLQVNQAEQNLWDSIKDSGNADQLRLYLRVYPSGVFRPEAERRLAALARSPELSFTAPLPTGDDHVRGRAISELIKGQPLFPPFEGIPDELWKGQHCSNCHQWTKELLCEQGQFYMTENSSRSMGKQHPYGGTFKQNVSKWAAAGCK